MREDVNAAGNVGLETGDVPVANLDFLWLELTSKCNLSCVHCYAESGPRLALEQNVHFEDWMKILSDAHSIGCKAVQFIGGEPTEYPKLPILIGHAKSLGYDFIEVFTNGTCFTDTLRQTFKKFGVHLAFSVYGPTPEVHDVVTQRNGSFKKTIESIQWAIREGLDIRAAIISTDPNAKHIDATHKFLTDIGVQSIGVDHVRGVGRGSTATNREPSIDELCGKCWKGKLCVTPSGEIFPCVFSRFWPVGQVKDGLLNILKGSTLKEFRTLVRSKSEVKVSTCNPQCGPDCSPAECGPQSDCGPLTCNPADRTTSSQRFNQPCGPDCTPNCTPMGCNPQQPNCVPDVCSPRGRTD